jgi:hypothetical protein
LYSAAQVLQAIKNHDEAAMKYFVCSDMNVIAHISGLLIEYKLSDLTSKGFNRQEGACFIDLLYGR